MQLRLSVHQHELHVRGLLAERCPPTLGNCYDSYLLTNDLHLYLESNLQETPVPQTHDSDEKPDRTDC